MLPEPYLGCATTEDLINELIARFVVSRKPEKAHCLQEFLKNLDEEDKQYKTIDQ